jgi:hypothetical protein
VSRFIYRLVCNGGRIGYTVRQCYHLDLAHGPGFYVSQLLQQFVWIAFLQGRPQDMPAGRSALGVAFVLNLLTHLLAITSDHPFFKGLQMALLDITISGLCLYLAVTSVNKSARFLQAYTALLGGTAVLNTVAIPILWLNSETVGLLDIAIIVWVLAIIAHVLRHTLEVETWVSVLMAFAFYIIGLQMMALTGVIRPDTSAEQQLSLYQPLITVWLSVA